MSISVEPKPTESAQYGGKNYPATTNVEPSNLSVSASAVKQQILNFQKKLKKLSGTIVLISPPHETILKPQLKFYHENNTRQQKSLNNPREIRQKPEVKSCLNH